MMRFALTTALVLAACNPPEGKDRVVLSPTMHPLEDGSAIGLMTIEMNVDETARSYDNEMDIGIGGLFEEGAELNIGFDVLDGLETIGSAWRTSADDAENAVFTPDFDRCEGNGFEIEADQSCTYTVTGIIGGDRVYSVLMGFTLRSQAPKDEEGEDVAVLVSVVEAQPEAQ